MTYERKNMQGSLFSRAKQTEKQPDKTGTIMIEGKLYYLSAWERVSQGGKP